MNSARFILSIGLVIAFLPFVGIPVRWFRILLPIIGLVLIIEAFRLYLYNNGSSFNQPAKKKEKQQSLFESVESTEEKQNAEPPKEQDETRGGYQAKKESDSKLSSPQPKVVEKNHTPEVKRKYFELSAQMLGRTYQRKAESGRLAERLDMKRKEDLDIERTVPTPKKDSAVDNKIKEVMPADDVVEVIVDDELLVGEGVYEDGSDSPLPNEEEVKTEIVETPIEEDEPSVFEHYRHDSIDSELLERISDDIEEE